MFMGYACCAQLVSPWNNVIADSWQVLAHIYRGRWGILDLLQHSYKAQQIYHGLLLATLCPAF